MARSKILKDYALNKTDLESILKQLKLLLIDFRKKELVEWIDNEIEGYSESTSVPSYRECKGLLKGSFLNYTTQCKNLPIPQNQVHQMN